MDEKKMVKKKDKNKMQKAILLGFGLIAMLVVAGYVANNWDEMMTWNPFGPGDTGIDPDAADVYVKITTRNSISKASCDLIVNMYDENGNDLDTCTTSSGVGTFSGMYKEGQHLWLQARQAAPATTTYYLTPLTEYVVPKDNSISTVSLGTLFVDQVTTTNPTMVIRNGWNNATVVDTANDINTTATAITISIANTVDNMYYGADGCVDQITGDEYLAGVWILWKGTASQPWVTNPTYTASDNTYYYYVFHMNRLPYNSNGDVSLAQSIITLSVGSTTFTADASLVISAYDLFCISDWNAGIYSAFDAAHSVSVTAITTDID